VSTEGFDVKSLIEILRISQGALNRDGRTADALRVQGMLNVFEALRPTGSNGKHGVKHTLHCGCEDISLRDNMISLALNYITEAAVNADQEDTPEDKYYAASGMVMIAADILKLVEQDFEND